VKASKPCLCCDKDILRGLSFVWLVFQCLPISEYWAAVEWYRGSEPNTLEMKPVSVPLCRRQVPQTLTKERATAFAVRRRRLISWTIACYYAYSANSRIFGISYTIIIPHLLKWLSNKIVAPIASFPVSQMQLQVNLFFRMDAFI
jgi:hypothetical protein